MNDSQPLETVLLLTCEHGGNFIPDQYAHLFEGAEKMLDSHWGMDFGALEIFTDLRKKTQAPGFFSLTTRLLADLNRSKHHPSLLSYFSKKLKATERETMLSSYYDRYRQTFQLYAEGLVARGFGLCHLSIHTFTPELNGDVRQADIGILYDPAVPSEKAFAATLKKCFATSLPSANVRFNYPYLGTADGLTTHLRKAFKDQNYMGFELEANQKFFEKGGDTWQNFKDGFVEATSTACQGFLAQC